MVHCSLIQLLRYERHFLTASVRKSGKNGFGNSFSTKVSFSYFLYSCVCFTERTEQNQPTPPLKNDVHLLTQVLFILEKIGFFIFLFLFLLSSYYIGISLAENIYCINRKISRLLGKQFWLVLLTQANRKKLVGCWLLCSEAASIFIFSIYTTFRLYWRKCKFDFHLFSFQFEFHKVSMHYWSWIFQSHYQLNCSKTLFRLNSNIRKHSYT